MSRNLERALEVLDRAIGETEPVRSGWMPYDPQPDYWCPACEIVQRGAGVCDCGATMERYDIRRDSPVRVPRWEL